MFDGQALSLYKDGVFLAGVPNAVGSGFNNDPLYVGAFQGASRFFSGTVDDVRVFSSARTPDQLLQDFRNPTPPLGMFSTDAGNSWGIVSATYPVSAGAPFIGIGGGEGTNAAQSFQLLNFSIVQSTSAFAFISAFVERRARARMPQRSRMVIPSVRSARSSGSKRG